MRPYCALYVDAGYLLASAATRVTGTSLRGGVTVDHKALIESLIDQAEQASGLPLLRVNWYDSGARSGGNPDTTQEAIGLLPKVKLRLGRLSPNGEQKGVDLRLGLDLATHARNRIVDLMFLVSGDDDLTEAVEEAQGHGIQVILLASPDDSARPHAVSLHLLRESDGLLVIHPETIDQTVRAVRHEEAVSATRPSATAPEGPAAGSTVAPTPMVLAGRKPPPNTDVLAARDAARARQEAIPLYSTRTGEPPMMAPGALAGHPQVDEEHARLIDQVCHSVVTTWNTTATEEDRRALMAGRPYIPPHLDRALLVDLSAAIGTYEIDEPSRYHLRDHFWDVAIPVIGEVGVVAVGATGVQPHA